MFASFWFLFVKDLGLASSSFVFGCPNSVKKNLLIYLYLYYIVLFEEQISGCASINAMSILRFMFSLKYLLFVITYCSQAPKI